MIPSGIAQVRGRPLSQTARNAANVTARTPAVRHQCRLTRSPNEKPLDHMAQTRILRGHTPGEQVDYVGILPGKELLKSTPLEIRRIRKVLIQPAQQQDVQFTHPAPAPPAQLPRVHSRRSTSMRLIEAIAFAGFRSFGQALVQFMIVWQRYSRNGSSR